MFNNLYILDNPIHSLPVILKILPLILVYAATFDRGDFEKLERWLKIPKTLLGKPTMLRGMEPDYQYIHQHYAPAPVLFALSSLLFALCPVLWLSALLTR